VWEQEFDILHDIALAIAQAPNFSGVCVSSQRLFSVDDKSCLLAKDKNLLQQLPPSHTLLFSQFPS